MWWVSRKRLEDAESRLRNVEYRLCDKTGVVEMLTRDVRRLRDDLSAQRYRSYRVGDKGADVYMVDGAVDEYRAEAGSTVTISDRGDVLTVRTKTGDLCAVFHVKSYFIGEVTDKGEV